jgi:hypothetical protein
MSTAVGTSVGFGVYLVVAALLTAVPFGHTAGIVLLLAIAGTLSWWATIPGAVGIGALGWLFYSGFVTHAHGQLGVTGPRDAVVLGMLVGATLLSAGARRLLSQGGARPVIPAPRSTVD